MARTEESAPERDEMELEGDAGELRVYELGFHIDPELPQEEVKKTYQAVRETIAKAGTIVAEGEPQNIQLAYTISRGETTGRRDFNSAFFAWIAYEAETAGHASVTEVAGAEKRIIRFIDLRTTKEEAQHSAEMQEIYLKAAQEQLNAVDEEAVADVELDAALKDAGV